MAIGMDVGDQYSHLAGVELGGKVLWRQRIRSTYSGVEKFFSEIPRGTRVVLEAGTHSPWISGILKELGHEAIVANPHQAGRAILANGGKNDDLDSELLGSFGLNSPNLLRPIVHRSPEAQADLAIVRARGGVVEARTKLIQAVRGMVKSSGHRLPVSSAEAFPRKCRELLPERLEPALVPLLETIEVLTQKIRGYDKKVDELSEKYPEISRLRTICGVGPLVAASYVLTLDDPRRFKRSRQVGPYVGLVSRQHESGENSPQLRITKAGDRDLRRLLVISSQYILSKNSEDSDLKRFGLRLAARGGKRAKRQAVVAVARKLAVLMHRLWVAEEVYDPFYSSRKAERLRA
jgi:transposase